MELIYSVRRKPLRNEPPYYANASQSDTVRPICTISVCNIIAFSSPTMLSDTEGDTWGGHVYVCDLDTPWDSFKVTSTTDAVTALEWDCEGKNLLVATIAGSVSVYGQKDYLLNEWTCLYNATFPGEHIIKATFFHNGRRIVAVDKKPEAPITDRWQLLRSTPTMKGFGGCGMEGALVVTVTGLVCALGPRMRVAESLRARRLRLAAASFAHAGGSVVVAAWCRGGAGSGGGGGAVLVARAGLSRGPPPSLTLHQLPAIPLDEPEPHVSVAWCAREEADSLLVAGATLALWKLTERSSPVHKRLKGVQGNNPGAGNKPSDCFNTLVWQQVCSWATERAVGVCALGPSPGAAPGPHVLLAAPHKLHLLSTTNHHYICSVSVASGREGALAGTPPKKHKYGGGPSETAAAVSSACVSRLGGAVVALDARAQLHVYKLPQPWADLPVPLAAQHALSQVEYSLLSGHDCLDLLMTLKPNLHEPLYERLTESFQRQPQPFQQYYYHSWLKLRIAVCRCSAWGAESAAGLALVSSALAGCAALAAALRPDDRADLALLTDDQPHPDHEKVLASVEAKCEVVSEAGALVGLRRVLQRALHAAATVLAAAAHHAQPAHHHHGYEVWSDAAGLSAVRRAAAGARAAGRGAGAEGVLRALARLAVHAHPHHARAPLKPDLLEECVSLSAAAPARVWEAWPRCAVSAPHRLPHPYHLEYGVEPEALRHFPEPPAYAQSDTTPYYEMDSIRYMYLGAWSWRRCSRCGARALPAPPAPPAPRAALQRAHDDRHLPDCRCGGKWALFVNA